MTLLPYFTDISEEMLRVSERVRRDFATHRPSAGENRETIVAEFLRSYLPKTFGIDTGLILSRSGQFSNEADLVIVDQAWNAPLYPTSPNRIWLVESVFALLEVKTSLPPAEIRDAVAKCRRFKTLPRTFDELPNRPKLGASPFVLWGFESPSTETFQENLSLALEGVPRSEQPDFVIVPGRFVISGGEYLDISTHGVPGGVWRTQLEQEHGTTDLPLPSFRIAESEHALLIWLFWMTQWLKGAGNRSAPLVSYIPEGLSLGRILDVR